MKKKSVSFGLIFFAVLVGIIKLLLVSLAIFLLFLFGYVFLSGVGDISKSDIRDFVVENESELREVIDDRAWAAGGNRLGNFTGIGRHEFVDVYGRDSAGYIYVRVVCQVDGLLDSSMEWGFFYMPDPWWEQRKEHPPFEGEWISASSDRETYWNWQGTGRTPDDTLYIEKICEDFYYYYLNSP